MVFSFTKSETTTYARENLKRRPSARTETETKEENKIDSSNTKSECELLPGNEWEWKRIHKIAEIACKGVTALRIAEAWWLYKIFMLGRI